MADVSNENALANLRSILEENQNLREQNQQLRNRLQHIAELAAVQDPAVEPAKQPHSIFGKKIDSLGLGLRAKKAIETALRNSAQGYSVPRTLLSLVQLTADELLGIKYCGQTSLRDIKMRLNELNLWMGMTEQEITDWKPSTPTSD